MLKREIIVKEDCETDFGYGCFPENRLMQNYINFGAINLDKPSGPSSHEVAAWVKKILNVKRAGHGGTLEA
jgi:H/ACA ribonucleoprotein complex subunit 4